MPSLLADQSLLSRDMEKKKKIRSIKALLGIVQDSLLGESTDPVLAGPAKEKMRTFGENFKGAAAESAQMGGNPTGMKVGIDNAEGGEQKQVILAGDFVDIDMDQLKRMKENKPKLPLKPRLQVKASLLN